MAVERFFHPEITRRQLLRGVGGTLLGISVGDVGFNGRKAHKRKGEAKANVMEQGINPPEPKAVANAQKLSEKIRENPLAEQNPDEGPAGTFKQKPTVSPTRKLAAAPGT